MGFLDKILPPGKMQINLNAVEYHPGNAVKGILVLTTKHPINARGIEVRVHGFKEYKRRDSFHKGKMKTVTEDIFDFSKKLDTEKEYTGAEYPFEITIPQNVYGPKRQKLEGTLGAAVEAVGSVMGALQTSNINWYVEGKLDIPGGRDISKRVKIKIGRAHV